MQLRLGINDCFAVKRWPQTLDWGPIVRERLGLRLVQHSFDLVDLTVDDPRRLRQDLAILGVDLHSTFTGLAAYLRRDGRPFLQLLIRRTDKHLGHLALLALTHGEP